MTTRITKSAQRMLALGVAALASVPAMADPVTGTAVDTTGYQQAFANMSMTLQSVATGPIGLGAFGLLIIGIVFGLAWRLLRKGAKSLG